MKIIVLLLCLCLCGTSLADSAPAVIPAWPADMAEATVDHAAEAAALLHMDEAALSSQLREGGVCSLAVSAGGTVWQLNVTESSLQGLDFGSMGQKKAAIFAQQLAFSSGQTVSVVKLRDTGDAPSPTLAPGRHRSKLWVLLSPGDGEYPRTDTWLTAIRGYELTLTCTWPSQQEEDKRSESLLQALYGLTIMLPSDSPSDVPSDEPSDTIHD